MWRAEDEEALKNMSFFSQQAQGYDFQRMDISCCRFQHCSLTGCDLSYSVLTDVVFKDCDLSSCRFDDSYFKRAVFIGCRLTGTLMGGSGMSNVLFEDCLMPYSNLGRTRLERVIFRLCRMGESVFTESRFKDCQLDECDIAGGDFMHAALAVSYTHLDVYKRQHPAGCAHLRRPRPGRALHPHRCGTAQAPVSYTHLDVYKRQLSCTGHLLCRRSDGCKNVYRPKTGFCSSSRPLLSLLLRPLCASIQARCV